MPSTVAKYFAFAHLTNPNLHAVSAACAQLAERMETGLPDGPEKSAGMRKLLEAKDCFVRSALDMPIAGTTIVETPGGKTLMLEPHQMRVVNEAADLHDRAERLLSFIGTTAYDALPVAEREDLRVQHGQMGALLATLNRRIERFGSKS